MSDVAVTPLGPLPHEWTALPLAEVTTKIGSGATPRGGKAVYIDEGVAFIRSQNVTDHEFSPEGLAHIDADAALALKGVTVEKGDVLLNITGESMLRCCVVSDAHLPARVSQHVAIIRPSDVIRPVVLQKILTLPAMKQYMASHSSGATRKAITKGHIESFLVPVPPMAEQLKMEELFGALDQRIERNRRITVLCNRLAQTECEYGLAGSERTWEWAWPESQLGDHLSVVETGGRPKGGVRGIDSGVPSIGAESITCVGEFDFGKTKYVPEDFFSTMTRGVLSDGDVLLYKDGGRPGEFEPHVSMFGGGFPFDRAAINEHVYRLRTDGSISQAFLYQWLSSPRIMEEMRRRGTGVAIPGLNSTNLKDLPLILPPSDRLSEVEERIGDLMTLALERAREARSLSQIRDALALLLLGGIARFGPQQVVS